MRRLTPLALALLLAACQATGPITPARSAAPRTASAAPSASTRPAALTSQAPSRAPIATTLLTGTIALDAGYLVASGAGIVANDGATIVANDGATLIGQDGTSLIGQDGTSLIGQDGTSYALLASQAPPLGTLLPVAGMALRVLDLGTGRDLTAEAGFAAAQRSDAQGRFSLAIPSAVLAGAGLHNVRIHAEIPGRSDARLSYDLLSTADDTRPRVFDENTAKASAFFRVCFRAILVSRFMDRATGEVEDKVTFNDQLSFGPALEGLFDDKAAVLVTRARALGVPDMPEARRTRIAQAMVDQVLSGIDVEATPLDPDYVPGWTPAPGTYPATALGAVTDVLRRIHEAAAAKLNGGGETYFDAQPFYTEAVAARAAAHLPPLLQIRKPSDLNQFLIDAYLTEERGNPHTTFAAVLETLGLPSDDSQQIQAAQASILFASMKQLLSDEGFKAADDTFEKAVVESAP